MIKTAIRFKNNMVMVFDKRGEQIPKYQGQYGKVKESILGDALPDTIFALGLISGLHKGLIAQDRTPLWTAEGTGSQLERIAHFPQNLTA